jgi:hypothetical protein
MKKSESSIKEKNNQLMSLKVLLQELKMFKVFKVHLQSKFQHSIKNLKTIRHFETF